MSNTLLTSDVISREAMMILKNNCRFPRFVSSRFENLFAKNGDTIHIRKPPRFTVATGAALNPQDSTETQTPLTVSQYNIGLPFTSAELTLSIEEYAKRFLEPAVKAMANKFDVVGLQTAAEAAFHSVGTPGTTPTAIKTYQQALAKIQKAGAPQDDDISAFFGPDEQVEILDQLKGLFVPSKNLERQNLEGMLGRWGGMNFVSDQNINRHTVGALGGTPLVNGAVSSGSSIVTDGWTGSVTGVVKKGDVLTFTNAGAACNEVNPQNRLSVGALAQFVVTADADSDAGGNATISVSPSIVTSGAFQNVTTGIENNAVIKVFGHASSYAGLVTADNLVFHQDAIQLANVQLVTPRGAVETARVTDPDTGLTLRVLYFYDGFNDREYARLDMLNGWAVPYPELICRVQG